MITLFAVLATICIMYGLFMWVANGVAGPFVRVIDPSKSSKLEAAAPWLAVALGVVFAAIAIWLGVS